MTDLAAGDLFLTHGEAAEMLGCSIRTVGRLMSTGALAYVRQTKQRKPYRGQVRYVAAQYAEGRTGSVKEFCDEWKALQHVTTFARSLSLAGAGRTA